MIALRGWTSRVDPGGFCSVVVRYQSNSIALRVTKQLTFYTTEKTAKEGSANGVELEEPIVVLYGWLLAKNKALRRFVDYYVSKGCDVLTVKTSPTEFMWPSKAQRIIDDVFDFADQDRMRDRSILIHTFSVGGYMYGETLLRSTLPKQGGREPLKNRIVGQIIDSPIDFAGVPNGLALTLFAKSRFLQSLMKSTFHAYLYGTYPFTMRHYMAASTAFHDAPAIVPSLWFYSKVDSFMSAEDIEKVIAKWEAMGIACRKMCWQDSPHILHFKRNGEEYVQQLDVFLRSIRESKTELEPTT